MHSLRHRIIETVAPTRLGRSFRWLLASTVVRQRAVPDELLGRVGGVYRVAVIGGMLVGSRRRCHLELGRETSLRGAAALP